MQSRPLPAKKYREIPLSDEVWQTWKRKPHPLQPHKGCGYSQVLQKIHLQTQPTILTPVTTSPAVGPATVAIKSLTTNLL